MSVIAAWPTLGTLNWYGMNRKAVVVAIAFALLGGVSLFLYVKRVQVEATGGEKIEVLIVTKEVRRNVIITDDVLGTREIPMAYVEDRMIRMTDKAKVVGVKTDTQLIPQQTLIWSDVQMSSLDSKSMGGVVQAGSRAFTMQIPRQYMSVRLIRPGDYVDIVGVVFEAHEQSASVLLQKVLVMAVNSATEANEMATGTDQQLTISVSLPEAQMLALATQRGPIMPVLRSDSDTSTIQNVPGIKMVINRELRTRDPGPAPAPAVPVPLPH